MRCKLTDKISSKDAFGNFTDNFRIRRQSSDQIFNELSLNDQYNYRSPYWKITDPKSSKPSRSVPGVPTYGSLYSKSKREPTKTFSPLLKTESLIKHPTILEVSGSYENYPNNLSKTESIKDENVNSYEKRYKVNKNYFRFYFIY